MIPKILHLCWLSDDEFPELVSRCIETWRKRLPDYEIKIWNTSTFDIDSVIWVKESYQNKKYAFAADYIRFFALYNYGGIYLDSDVEVLKSFNPLLSRRYFLGEEAGGDVEAAVIGAEKGLNWVKECLEYYDNRHFIKADGKFDMRPAPLLINSILKKYGLLLFPYTFFSPKDYNIGKTDITEDTYCIHHFDGKWVKKGIISRIKKEIHKFLYDILGRKKHNSLIHAIRPFIGH